MLELLSTYIPMDRRQAMAHGRRLPGRTSGAALFADISGFTPLTEALAKDLGPQHGAEELTRQLNLVYDALIAEVDRYGGSVIGFSGDAITCWFDADDDGWQAVTCALAMQAAMAQFAAVITPSGKQVTLTMKITVAIGPVWRFLVGDPNVQVMDALAGATLDRLAAAEHMAGKGEVVLSAEVIKALGDHVTILEWRKDETTGERFAVVNNLAAPAQPAPWPDIEPGALSEAQVRPWVLSAVYKRMSGGQGAFLTELRPTVALFLHFGGIDYDLDEGAGAKLDAYTRWVQSVLALYEGTLIQLTIGEKGSYIYAAFGAPYAHEDDARRAVTAAMELLTPPPSLGFICMVQIGISRGTMRTGDYGGITRRTYGVLGDDVNLAARLMLLAPFGEMLVSQRVQKATAEVFVWERLSPVTVKGKAQPVAVYRPTGEKKKAAQAGPEAIIIGRIAERAALAENIQKLGRGAGGVVIIEGEAGIGKSLLVTDLRRQAEAMQVETFYSAGDAIEKSTPYYAWRGVFSQLFGISVLEDPETQQRHLMGLIGDEPELSRLAPLLTAVLPFQLPDNEFTAQMAGQVRADNTRQLLIQFLQGSVSRSPKIIILENAHWLDSLSWELILHVARTMIASGARLLMVLATRPMDEHAAGVKHLATLQTHETTTLHLAALSPEETVAIAAARLGLPTENLPGPVAELVRQQAEGNPFFAEELVFTLRDRGILSIESDPARCVITGDLTQAAQTLPDTVQGLILARIDRLPSEQQLTLKVASVVGRIFAYALLGHTLKPYLATGNVALRHYLDALTALDLIALHTLEPDLTYSFEQIITQEVAYQTLLFVQRRQLHNTVAEWYEATFPERLDDLATMLAYHYTLADVKEKAIVYLLRAGDKTRKAYALQEAIEHYGQALHITQDLGPDKTIEQRQTIHAALGELLTLTSQYEQALPHLDKALSLAATQDNCNAQAHACRWLARLHELRGEYPLALDWIERGLNTLGGQETTEAAELLLIAGLIHTRQGSYDKALERCEKGLSIAAKLNDASALARAYTLLGHIASRRGNSAAAVEHFQHALDLYQRVSDINGQATSHNQIANAYFGMGRWREAEQSYCQARAVFSKMGDIYHRAFADNNLGGIARNQGRLDEALMFYHEALRALEQIGGSPYVLGALHMNLGATFISRGEVEAAYEHLHTSQAYFQRAKARDFLPEMHRHFAEAALRAGNLSEAEVEARQALSLARELAMRGEEGNSLRMLGEIALMHGQFNLAEERLRQSVAILGKMGDEYEQARSQLSLARLYHAQKNSTAEADALDQCMPVFERLGAELDLSMARTQRKAKVIP